MKKYAVCPLCQKPMVIDLSGDEPSVAYFRGWHHTECVLDYLEEDESEDE